MFFRYSDMENFAFLMHIIIHRILDFFEGTNYFVLS